MISQQDIHLVTIIIISIGMIFLGGSFLYKHLEAHVEYNNPMFFALAITLIGFGGKLLIDIIIKHAFPLELSQKIKYYS